VGCCGVHSWRCKLLKIWLPEAIDWIDIDPAYQKEGSNGLSHELIKNLKTFGVKTIDTLVSWNDWSPPFFHIMGSPRGDMINLELKI